MRCCQCHGNVMPVRLVGMRTIAHHSGSDMAMCVVPTVVSFRLFTIIITNIVDERAQDSERKSEREREFMKSVCVYETRVRLPRKVTVMEAAAGFAEEVPSRAVRAKNIMRERERERLDFEISREREQAARKRRSG